MKKLRELLPAPLAALKMLSRNPADKTWNCQRCGEVPPITLADGWYARRMCACERAAHERQQLQQLHDELALTQLALTYTWLGRAWSETALSEKTFENFQRERQPAAYDLAYAFAQHPQGVLALFGSFGTGKTHLLAGIANHLRLQGRACLFASAVTLFDACQDRIQQNQDYHELIKRGTSTPLLLLDDVDKLKPSEFREETLYKLINGRINAGLPLALSSNCTPNQLERWVGKAGRSRLMTGLIPVQMNGPDFRLGDSDLDDGQTHRKGENADETPE